MNNTISQILRRIMALAAAVTILLMFDGTLFPQEIDKSSEMKAQGFTYDLLYFQNRLVNLPTANSLLQFRLQVTFLHRFVSNLTDPDQSEPINMYGIDNGAEID